MTKDQAIKRLKEINKINTFGMDMYELADIHAYKFNLEYFIKFGVWYNDNYMN